MEKLTLKQKAARANGKSRMCTNCRFLFVNLQICDVCSKAFREGYQKGYKKHRDEQKQEGENND